MGNSVDKIKSLGRFGSKLGLDRMNRLMAELGVSCADFKIIHVAGTNGKGSVCTMLDKILRAHGIKTGMYTSPYLSSYRDSIAVDGRSISCEDLDRVGETVLEAADKLPKEDGELAVTEFEVITGLALYHFKEVGAEYVILETGLGGALDSTNIAPAKVAVITSISYDHMDVLGDSLAEIAKNKAGIIKEGATAVVNVDEEEALSVIKNEVCKKHANIVRADEAVKINSVDYNKKFSSVDMSTASQNYGRIKFSLLGKHQLSNLKTVIATVGELKSAFGFCERHEITVEALGDVHFSGRFEVFEGDAGCADIVLDGAHNVAGIEALEQNVKLYYPNAKILAVTSMLGDKQVDEILHRLCKFSNDVIFTEINNERRISAHEMLEIAKQSEGNTGNYQEIPDTGKAFTQAYDSRRNYDLILFTGSLYMMGDIRRRLHDEGGINI